MNVPFFIAGRYLFARKSRNVINVISGITMAGIALASMAMVCTLFVFNGFSELMESLFTDFDPELKIVSVRGKVFDPASVGAVDSLPYVEKVTFSLQDQALARYKSTQQIVTVKGVEDDFRQVYSIDNILYGSGTPMLSDEICEYGIMGIGLMNILDCGIQPTAPITLYAPKRGTKINMTNPAANFKSESFYSPGVSFQVNQQPYDDTYVLVPMSLARRLFSYSNEVSSIDVKIRDGYPASRAHKELQKTVGDGFDVLDRYEQQADVFKVVRLEKFVSYLFLTFILLVACFNIIGSLVMLMLEKKEDSRILESIGMTEDAVSRIFIIDGVLTAVIGASAGILLGVLLALLQQWLGFIPLGANGGFVVDTYPVCVKLADIIVVLVTVTLVTLLSLMPIRRIADRFVRERTVG